MTFEQQSEQFETWLKSHGVEISNKVGLHDYREAGQGRGLIALEDIAEGDVLFTIPQTNLLAVERDPKFGELVTKHELADWPALMAYMMLMSGTDRWAPYFAVLPSKFSTPMFWNPEQLELLKGSAVLDKVGRAEADELYDELASSIFKDQAFANVDVSRESFHRMGSLIMAYGFDVSVTGDDDDAFKAMVPLADMLNSHTVLGNARLEMPENVDGVLEMVASKDIKKGEQVYNVYGDLSNGELLRRYGYVEAGGTEYDMAEVSMEALIKSVAKVEGLKVEQIEERVEELQEYDEELLDDGYDVVYPGMPDVNLVAVANALTLALPAKKAIKTAIEMADEEEITAEGRLALQDLIETRLQDYQETNALTEPEDSTKIYTDINDMCNQVLASERKILERALEWVRASDDGAAEPAAKRRHVTA
ncbi:Ribosomal lysine N-methyltransferase 4 [Wickerhamiella sorbophila]|uniref:Ribosomal lysine N-methyltransferase 4 n=1 Tax=Wickerhamiella sorbophila TaxID=45607 RepID=A0A2T0FP54_9ASCO|nr:Ribosomal lysine N-methyltransferase 4 [Wickerhamiella sorbophila]PRT56758.1 Ribosomal lysine N-methyltransferase 4 [Wickerhamiella sorbophila]